jgi:hypothetical protein
MCACVLEEGLEEGPSWRQRPHFMLLVFTGFSLVPAHKYTVDGFNRGLTGAVDVGNLLVKRPIYFSSSLSQPL